MSTKKAGHTGPVAHYKELQAAPLMTMREVCELFRVSPSAIKRWDETGALKAIRINSRGDRRYRRDVIEAFINDRQE